jgi:hypothetical protein
MLSRNTEQYIIVCVFICHNRRDASLNNPPLHGCLYHACDISQYSVLVGSIQIFVIMIIVDVRKLFDETLFNV